MMVVLTNTNVSSNETFQREHSDFRYRKVVLPYRMFVQWRCHYCDSVIVTSSAPN